MTLKFPDSNKSRGIGNLRLTLGISEFGILAPSKFHDVEIPRFQPKSWNREFEAHTRKLGIVILAYTVLPVHSVET